MLITVLIVNSVALAVFTVLFAYFMVINADVQRILRSGIERLSSEYRDKQLKMQVKKYSRAIPLKMTIADKIELYLIDKSNIRHYIPFANFYFVMLVCMLIFAFTFRFIYKILLFAPSAAVVSLLFSLIPLFILDIMGKYNSEVIRKRLAEFISVLNRWCAVKEDIFYAFEKSVDSGIGEPLKTFIRDMVIQVNRGVDPLEALDILWVKVDNIQFRDFIINIKQNIRHRGDIRKLLTNMEEQFYKIEEEYNRRKISTYVDRMLLYIIMFTVLFTGYFFLKSNPLVKEFYINTMQGKLLLTLFAILYSCGLYMIAKITRFEH